MSAARRDPIGRVRASLTRAPPAGADHWPLISLGENDEGAQSPLTSPAARRSRIRGLRIAR